MILKKKKIILAIFVILGLFAAGYFILKSWQGKKNSTHNIIRKPDSIEEKNISSSGERTATISPEENSKVNSPNDDSDDVDIAEDETVDIAESSYLDLDDADCSNNCSEYDEPYDLGYCKEYCGIESVKLITDDCDGLDGLEQDYCFKHMAQKNKDLSVCQVILDENIKQACNKQAN
ncbi:MAG: hypothetical protein WCO05_00815 [Candidatus Moraniibacteriota bacterium]